jgi:DNA repair protein RecN (Recombination protein N)
MLQSLHIVNFVIIEDVSFELDRGVSIFTGETGAGKSVLVDALAVLTGRRASVEDIRRGTPFFQIEGVFSAESPEIRNRILEDCGFEPDEGTDIVLTRRLNSSGRGQCRINGTLCSVRQLEQMGQKLVRLHEQNDNERLLAAGFCRRMTDSYSEKGRRLSADYDSLYRQWRAMDEERRAFAAKRQENERRLDILKWETEEIRSADIRPGEDDEIEKKLDIAENREKIYKNTAAALRFLEDEDGGIERLSEAVRSLTQAARYDGALEALAEKVSSAVYLAQEASRDLAAYAESTEFSEEELNELQQRDEILNGMKKKYGPALSDVLAYFEKGTAEYERLHSMIYENEEAEKKWQALTESVMEKAGALNRERTQNGDSLCLRIGEILHRLGMPHARLQFRLVPAAVPVPGAAEETEFLFSANEGEPLRPMRRVASGGEMTRISLAMESLNAGLFSGETLVFDEIDTGISGEVAFRVAAQIRQISHTVQVLCITHLPQTAAIADCHYRLSKEIRGGRTMTEASRLEGKAHIEEIAQMISGKNFSENAFKSAEELCRSLKK